MRTAEQFRAHGITRQQNTLELLDTLQTPNHVNPWRHFSAVPELFSQGTASPSNRTQRVSFRLFWDLALVSDLEQLYSVVLDVVTLTHSHVECLEMCS